jgi:antitoxin MazE
MLTALRPLGNSQAVLIPKVFLTELGLKDEVEMTLENDSLVIRPARQAARQGWAADSKALAASGDDALLWPEISSEIDEEWQW